MLFDIAWDGKGLILNLTEWPDDLLEHLVVWRNERVEQDNRALEGHK